MRETVVSGKYPESRPVDGKVAYQRLTKTGFEPCQGCPGRCYYIKKDGKWRRTPR